MSSQSKVIDRNLAVAIAVVVALAVTTLVVVIAKNSGRQDTGSSGVGSSSASSAPASTSVSTGSSTRSPGPSPSAGAGDPSDGKGAFVGDAAGAPPGWRRIYDSETEIATTYPPAGPGHFCWRSRRANPKRSTSEPARTSPAVTRSTRRHLWG